MLASPRQAVAAPPTPQVSVLETLDRVLDKGVVIDAWVRVSLAGIDLVTIQARIVVASIETYLKHSTALARTPAGLPHT